MHLRVLARQALAQRDHARANGVEVHRAHGHATRGRGELRPAPLGGAAGPVRLLGRLVALVALLGHAEQPRRQLGPGGGERNLLTFAAGAELPRPPHAP